MILLSPEEIINTACNIIKNSKSKCIICSPYLDVIPEIEESIEFAINRGVNVQIFGRKGEEHQFEDFIETFSEIDFFSIDHLHLKCYLNETELLLSTMNLTESSRCNVEAAVYSTDYSDITKIKSYLIGECNYRSGITSYGTQYCQICGRRIPINPKKILCYDCWNDRFGYQQRCKKCGRPIENNPDKPFCYDCYRDEQWYHSRYRGGYYY